MSSSGEPTGGVFRRAHIVRIFQKDDPESDVWVDIERIDEVWRDITAAEDGQWSHWTFEWRQDESSLPTKTIRDPHDRNNTIDVPIRKSIFVVSDLNGQGSEHQFINDSSNRSRRTHSRRVYHHDIKEGFLGGGGQPPRDPEGYFAALDEQDRDQYVDVEVIDEYFTTHWNGRDIHGFSIKSYIGLLNAILRYLQKRNWLSVNDRLLHDPMLSNDIADPSFVSTKNPSGSGSTAKVKIDPPWRLDPLQNIVNVNWSPGLAVIFGPQASDAPKQEKK